MDRPFKPLILGNGRHTLTVGSLIDASAFLLNEWPENRRGRKSYRLAVQAIVKAMAGRLEPEAARQAFLAALVDLWGKSSSEETQASRGAAERIRDGRY